MKMKTSELYGAALNFSVAAATGQRLFVMNDRWPGNSIINDLVLSGPVVICNLTGELWVEATSGSRVYNPSGEWGQGGPLVDAHEVCIDPSGSGTWAAKISGADWVESPSPLISACRAIVAAKLGDEVEVPDELL